MFILLSQDGCMDAVKRGIQVHQQNVDKVSVSNGTSIYLKFGLSLTDCCNVNVDGLLWVMANIVEFFAGCHAIANGRPLEMGPEFDLCTRHCDLIIE